MRHISGVITFLLVLYIGFIGYTNRALFFSSFDAPYWKDKFEHSQWAMPLSVRTIGDDGLYLYEGYRLIHGGDPTLFNAEVPPLGKYAIGASIRLFGNGYVYGYVTMTLLLVALFFLTRRLTRNPTLSLLITLLAATDPLLTAQFPLTMLDGLQALALLGFLLLLSLPEKQRRSWYPFTLGLMVGIFSEIKFPVLSPVVLLVGALTLPRKRLLRPLVWYGIGTLAGYVAPYIPYFFMGHTIRDWLGAQKWIISFYRNARLSPTWGSALVNLLAGRYQNIFSREWLPSSHWSPVWTVLPGTTLWGVWVTAKNKKDRQRWGSVAALSILFLLFFSVIPFWTRYLVLVLPLLYLLFARITTEFPGPIRTGVLSVLICLNIWSSIPVLFPTPEATLRQTAYNWEHQLFSDMYEDLTTASRRNIRRGTYRTFALSTLAGAEVEAVSVAIPPVEWRRFVSPQTIPVTVTYFTRNLGPFTERHDITLVKEDGRWRIPWDWSLLIGGLTLNRRVQTTVIPAKRGSLLASDKKPIAEDIPSTMIWVTPGRINPDTEDAMLKALEGLFDGKFAAVFFHQRVHGNSLPDVPIPIGIPPLPLTDKQARLLAAYPEITLTPAWGRRNYGSGIVTVGTVKNTQYNECCSHLYTTTTYDGVSGAERAKNSTLKGTNGGTLVLLDTDGTVIRTIIAAEKHDGKNTQP